NTFVIWNLVKMSGSTDHKGCYMLKKILFFLLLLFSSLLVANDNNDSLEAFINEQIIIERQLLDYNLSLEKKIKIKKNQEKRYQDFLLEYTSNQKDNLYKSNPYKDEINKLTIRLNSNKHRGNTNAVMRDEVLLQGYNLRKGIRTAFHEVLQQAESGSKALFKDKINETLVKYFSKYTPLDKKKYISKDQDPSSPIIISLHAALEELSYLENVSHTFSAEVVANSAYIYRSSRISSSRFFTFLKSINASPYGEKINTFLSPIHLDLARVILVFIIILSILVVQFLLRTTMNYILKYYHFEDDDIEYIHEHITKIFKYLASVLIIHSMLIVYIGIDSTSINMSKIFSVIYVILITLLLYRITNTIAYLKMESIKSSKVLKNEVINLMIKVSNGFLLLIALIVILKIFGVNLTALLSGLGIMGAAVAFAAKDSIANIFGSVSILLGDIFEQGDWIETKDVNGTVVEIGLRASTIRTFDNALISTPNFELANTSIKNWSRRSIGRRIKMNIGVTYESDFNDIHQAIDDIREMLKAHPGIANEGTQYKNVNRQAKLVSMEDFRGVKRTSLVYLDEFSNSSINILLYCFSKSVDWAQWLEVKEDVMFKIAKILEKNNLAFAYPTLTIHQADTQSDSEA
ncbi:MAG: mechanosensitive ion channel family protein, partial [Campylobacterota bacterium]|nr:mechanosensitive ion channel family protein [Campylobacterota bacterium]